MDIRHKIFTRSRVLLLLIALILLGAMAASVAAVSGVLRHRQELRRQEAAGQLEYFLQQASSVADGYVADRTARREQIRRALQREAGAVCADIEVFLQATLIRREAEKNLQRLQQVQLKKEKLLQLTRIQIARAAQLAKEAVANTAEAEKAKGSSEEGVTSSDGVTVESRDVESFFGASSVAGSSMENHAKKELGKLMEKLQELQSETGKKLEPIVGDVKNTDTEGWEERLLRDSGADIENLLPENSILTVAQAGGRILLALGGGSGGQSEIRAEASRTLLFNPQGTPQQWVLRVVLVESGAPVVPNVAELIARLALTLPADGSKSGSSVAGFIFSAQGELLGNFPRGSNAAVPQKEGRWSTFAEKSTLYRVAEGKSGWEIGLEFSLANLDTRRQLELIATDYPAYAAIFCVAQTIFLCGLVYLGILSWRANNGIVVAHTTGNITGAGTSVASLLPELGSLKRLQKANRGRSSDGSRILELAKSPVLRELAGKVRAAPKESGLREKPALRQYRS